MSANSSLTLRADYTDTVNFAQYSSGKPVIRSVVIRNSGKEEQENLTLEITSGNGLCEPFSRPISLVPAGDSLEITDIPLNVNAKLLAETTERAQCELTLTLRADGSVLCRESLSITLLPYEYWAGSAQNLSLTAAFIMPNHPAVTALVEKASRILEKWTGDPSMVAYYSGPERVVKQAAAIYAAIQKENIVYMVDPPSFERVGQRVRLCDTILRDKRGNCIDLTLLFCACLEAIGLFPLVVMTTGHAFAGVHLERKYFPEAVITDAALLQKHIASGTQDIALFECTAVTAGKICSFDAARDCAEKMLDNPADFDCAIDVRRARMSGVAPMPMRVTAADGFSIIRPKRDDGLLTRQPNAADDRLDLSGLQRQVLTKQLQWERRLLDLSLRNSLINLHLKRSVVPVMASSCDALESTLRRGGEIPLLACPKEFAPEGDKDSPEYYMTPDTLCPLIDSEMASGRLRACLADAPLEKTLKALFRTQKLSLDETGANTFHVAMGFLKWFDADSKPKPHYAPIVLLPAELIRKSAGKGYSLRLREEEAVVNVTLLEKLRQEHKLIIDGLSPLPRLANGCVDYRKVFAIVRTACMEHDGWTVAELPVAGNFSFGQFAMWNDVKNRTAQLAENPITSSLIQGRLTWDAKPLKFDPDCDRFYTPLPSDASQLAAIAAAAEGLSFVLHGPPGTGKSQTIVNMIVNLIAHGKRVLVVAEKMAALDVVLQRLNKLGLGDFCLELHSSRATARTMLDQLHRATEITARKPPEAYAQKAETLASLRSELDGHVRRMHDTLPCGMSLYTLIERYERHAGAKNIAPLSNELLRTLNPGEIDRITLIARQLVAAAKAVGHPKDHPLSGVSAREYSIAGRVELQTKLEAFAGAAEACRGHIAAFASAVGREIPGSRSACAEMIGIAGNLQIWSAGPLAEWSREPQLENKLVEMQDAVNHFVNAKNVRAKILQHWKNSFLQLDGEKLYAEYRRIDGADGFTKGIKSAAFMRALRSHCEQLPAFDEMWVHLNNLSTYTKENSAATAGLTRCRSLFGSLYQGESTDWAAIQARIDAARKQLALGAKLPALDQTRAQFSGNAQALASARSCLAAWKDMAAARQALEGQVHWDDSAPDWLNAQLRACREQLDSLPHLREWITWLNQCDRAREAGLTPLLDAYAAGIDHDDVLPAFQKSIYFSLAQAHIAGDPALNRFSGPVFSTAVEQFRSDEARLRELTAEEVYCRTAAQLPDLNRFAAESDEFTLFNRAHNSSGRGKSIRQLFEQMPHLIAQLAPCMLMSPSSVAQFLPDCFRNFDVVIFDETSQLQTCRAVGALTRADSAVIVGDPKQMPPTAFFAANAQDEDNPDMEDLDSILDDCLAVNLPQSHLLWHYRSRHESLIAFSNNQFYEGRLLTFPSVNDLESRVRMVHVPGGVFERSGSRTNRAEAEAVVTELKKRCHDPNLSPMSVGVVTFNLPQQNLIDDLLSAACREDEALEAWLNRADEPVFVKNLENVQGDERDVILFSVGYGPDAAGNVYMNFGPLNRDGGWRRLNVAVTRARDEMLVFSTLRPEQINLSRSSAKGVAAMRAFLEYAERRTLTLNADNAVPDSDSIAKGLCDALEARGWKTRRAIGASRFRIDVGVLDPADESRYLLGILLDGAVYGQDGQTTRDREIGRAQVLENLGWTTHRLYALDWWDDRARETERILARLNRLCPAARTAG